jgi:transcriptional regulator with XRE-family HTH domain
MALLFNIDGTDEADRLARHVRERRKGLGMTQEQLAQLAGLDPTHIRSIEAGEANPTLMVLCRLGHILGISASDLLR